MIPDRIFTHYVRCTDPKCKDHMMRVMNPRQEHYHFEPWRTGAKSDQIRPA